MKLNSGLPSQQTSLHEETEQEMKLNNAYSASTQQVQAPVILIIWQHMYSMC